MAPTANAAQIIGGKTIDSALGFLPGDTNKYTRATESKLANMRHTFEDVALIVCDEISMVGASKLLKINYRLQDLQFGERSKMYMGGISFIKESQVTENLIVNNGNILLQVLVGPVFNKFAKPSVTNRIKVTIIRCVFISRHEILIHTFTIS